MQECLLNCWPVLKKFSIGQVCSEHREERRAQEEMRE